MVVAGRVVGDDVAIAMIEAEAPVGAWNLITTDGAVAPSVVIGFQAPTGAWNLITTEGATAPSEEVVTQGLEAAKPFIRALCVAQADLAGRVAKVTQEFPLFPDYQPDVYDVVAETALGMVSEALTIVDKQTRENRLDEIKVEVRAQLADRFEGREKEISAAIRAVTKKVIRQRILTDGFRIDGRGLRDIRSLSAEVAVLARTHGSALFERGETQIMGVTTLAC